MKCIFNLCHRITKNCFNFNFLDNFTKFIHFTYFQWVLSFCLLDFYIILFLMMRSNLYSTLLIPHKIVFYNLVFGLFFFYFYFYFYYIFFSFSISISFHISIFIFLFNNFCLSSNSFNSLNSLEDLWFVFLLLTDSFNFLLNSIRNVD